jgi:serine/threonine-protein kinase PRP4
MKRQRQPAIEDDAEDGELIEDAVGSRGAVDATAGLKSQGAGSPGGSAEPGEYEERAYVGLMSDDEDEDELIERSRRRRKEVMAKYGRRSVEGKSKEPVTEMAEPSIGAVMDDNAEKNMIKISEETGMHMEPEEKREEVDEDEEDMFADTPTDFVNNSKDAQSLNDADCGNAKNGRRARGLLDNYDDSEGYYNFQVGELLGNRYEVFATHGKGVFSSVLRARDLKDYQIGNKKDDCPHVAVKVIRANETMYKAGQLEKVILNKISQADTGGTKHCIQMLDSFEYRNHLCLVFEAMDMNLRDLTKKYGRGIGLHITAVRVYATQMFVALQHLKECGVIHADVKPDNILVNKSRSMIKICDFGSAMFSGDNMITPYLVSRFYRAPEIILGLPYSHPIDMWSIGCVIYELFTGHILFQGRSNNEMLSGMMDLKGPFPKKMIKKAEFSFKHFDMKDANMAFTLEEMDPLTKLPTKRVILNNSVKEGLSKRLLGGADHGMRKQIAKLVDLLERILVLDPDKRLTPLEALSHPFIKGDSQGTTARAESFTAHAPRALHARQKMNTDER